MTNDETTGRLERIAATPPARVTDEDTAWLVKKMKEENAYIDFLNDEIVKWTQMNDDLQRQLDGALDEVERLKALANSYAERRR